MFTRINTDDEWGAFYSTSQQSVIFYWRQWLVAGEVKTTLSPPDKNVFLIPVNNNRPITHINPQPLLRRRFHFNFPSLLYHQSLYILNIFSFQNLNGQHQLTMNIYTKIIYFFFIIIFIFGFKRWLLYLFPVIYLIIFYWSCILFYGFAKTLVNLMVFLMNDCEIVIPFYWIWLI